MVTMVRMMIAKWSLRILNKYQNISGLKLGCRDNIYTDWLEKNNKYHRDSVRGEQLRKIIRPRMPSISTSTRQAQY